MKPDNETCMKTKPRKIVRELGLTLDEYEDLLRFCLCGQYPSSHTIERTGTTYHLGTEGAARQLYRALAGARAARRAFCGPRRKEMLEYQGELMQYGIGNF